MKESQEQVRKSILIIGERLGMKESTEMLLHNVGIYSTIKELAYNMFLQNYQDYFEKDNNVFDSIQLIRKYCEEMSINGEVKFDIPYSFHYYKYYETK